jgi:hypothetical protein
MIPKVEMLKFQPEYDEILDYPISATIYEWLLSTPPTQNEIIKSKKHNYAVSTPI